MTPGYIDDVAKRELMTEAEQQAWEAEMAEAGITVTTPTASTITLLRKTTEQFVGEGRAAGVEVTVTEASTGGEIVLLPGVRPPASSS